VGQHDESPLVLYLLDFGLARRTGDTERPRRNGRLLCPGVPQVPAG
jgi:hypothetical protein